MPWLFAHVRDFSYEPQRPHLLTGIITAGDARKQPRCPTTVVWYNQRWCGSHTEEDHGGAENTPEIIH